MTLQDLTKALLKYTKIEENPEEAWKYENSFEWGSPIIYFDELDWPLVLLDKEGALYNGIDWDCSYDYVLFGLCNDEKRIFKLPRIYYDGWNYDYYNMSELVK